MHDTMSILHICDAVRYVSSKYELTTPMETCGANVMHFDGTTTVYTLMRRSKLTTCTVVPFTKNMSSIPSSAALHQSSNSSHAYRAGGL